ncbi:MAG: NAD(+)/NADH kinase [Christensenellaceae bacterium]|jgi:NAD+ kinase|nr:NAD(+)/NADH kinase [Christensenellaceae bacterium]
MKIGIFTNLEKDFEARATKALVDLLSPKQLKIYVCSELKEVGLNLPCIKNNETLAKTVDLMIIFGGDGTILRIAKECAKYNTDVFAVNLGKMGFLAETEQENLLLKSQDILDGNFYKENRSILKAEFDGRLLGFALNEVVVERGIKSKLLKTEVRVNGAILDRYNSDGLIVATPTGSTAYSLSAGGPIIAPDVNAFVITPICPHTLHARPVIVSNNNNISVKILSDSSDAHVNLDGDTAIFIPVGKEIFISDSGLHVSFIRLKKYNYYDKLREKMSTLSPYNDD